MIQHLIDSPVITTQEQVDKARDRMNRFVAKGWEIISSTPVVLNGVPALVTVSVYHRERPDHAPTSKA